MTWDPKVECLGISLYHCFCTVTAVLMEIVNHQTWSNWNFLLNGEVLDMFLPLRESASSWRREREAVEINGGHLRPPGASPSYCADILEGKKC